MFIKSPSQYDYDFSCVFFAILMFTFYQFDTLTALWKLMTTETETNSQPLPDTQPLTVSDDKSTTTTNN